MKKTYSLATLGTVIAAACLSLVPFKWCGEPEKGVGGWIRIARYERSIVSYLFSKARYGEVRGGKNIFYEGVTRVVLFYGTNYKTTEVSMLEFSLIENLFANNTTDNFFHYRKPNKYCIEHQLHEPPGRPIKPGSCADRAEKGQPHPPDIVNLFAKGDILFSQLKE